MIVDGTLDLPQGLSLNDKDLKEREVFQKSASRSLILAF